MKRLIFALAILSSFIAKAQETTSNISEIKFNLLSTALGTIDVEFERSINADSSLGLSLFSTFDDSGKAFSYDYGSGITGFYRRYLGKNYASGLFFEGFSMFHSTRYVSNNRKNSINNNLLAGLGIGYKWVFTNGIAVQSNFGLGANLFDDEFETTSGRAVISIGYRF